MRISITQRGIYIRKNDLVELLGIKLYENILSDLTLINKTKFGSIVNTEERKLYKIGNIEGVTYVVFSANSNIIGSIYNELCNKNIDCANIFMTNHEVVNKVPHGDDIKNKLTNCSGINLYKNQQKIIDNLTENYFNDEMANDNSAGCVQILPTGEGKSYIATKLAELCGKKTLFIIPNTAQISEWKKIFSENYKNISIGEYHSKCKKDGDFVLMVVNSAINNEFLFSNNTKITRKEYFSKFGMVIYDEVHNYPTKQFQEIFWNLNCRYKLGITATHEHRSDIFDRVYPLHIGDIVKYDDIINNDKWEGDVTAIKYTGHPDYVKNIINKYTGCASFPEIVVQISNDPYRNNMIVELIKKNYNKNRNIFVFAENIKHLLLLKELTSKQAGINPDIIDKMSGGITPEDKTIIVANSRVIFITYSYGKEQISIPRMDTLILATPRKNKLEQIIGRITRKGGDISMKRKIYDIIDTQLSVKSQFYERKKVYLSETMAKNPYNINIKKKIWENYK